MYKDKLYNMQLKTAKCVKFCYMCNGMNKENK